MELLAELTSTRRQFFWSYYGPIRKIRTRLKSQPNGPLFDPIGAVCFAKTGVIFGEDHWIRAAEHLQLSSIDAGDLTAAANNVPSVQDQIYFQNLRRQIVENVSLHSESNFSMRAITELIKRCFPNLLRGSSIRGSLR